VTQISLLIVARNAAATIARALSSALAGPADEIVLVDHGSVDDTADRARAMAPHLRIVRLDGSGTVASARQVALWTAAGRIGVWLDADDELLPGRVARVVSALEASSADVVADAAELVTFEGHAEAMPVPPFLWRAPGTARLFERNYLPAPGGIAMRIDALRRLGYDATLHGAEDVDLLLRSIAVGMRLELLPDVGYRVHASPATLSRDLPNQRTMYRRALGKHRYPDVEALLHRRGASPRQIAWTLVSLAAYRGDWPAATSALGRARALVTDPWEVLEADGPCTRPEGWRVHFSEGTFALLAGRAGDALAALRIALRFACTPETWNNLGVALARQRDSRGARDAFERALRQRPGYADAARNLADRTACAVTTHPLREQRNRDDYPAAGRAPLEVEARPGRRPAASGA
jgi:hypothetical protein